MAKKRNAKEIGKELEKALSRNDLAAITDIVASRGPNVYVHPTEHHTLMHHASGRGHTDIVRLLIEKGANVNLQNTSGATPLHIACFNGHADLVKALLDAGADMYIEDLNEMTPFDDICVSKGYAFTSAYEEIGDLLIEHGYDINRIATHNNRTNLADACAWWSGTKPTVVRFLLSRGADPLIGDVLGKTALDYCLEHGSDETDREENLDLFREFHPELVMDAYCTARPGDR